MKLSTAGFLALAILLASPLSAQTTGGLDRAEAVGAFLNGALPNRTPRPSTGSWRLVNAFPNLTFIDPVQMVPVPFSNRLMVVEKAGRLTVFNNVETATTKTVLIDIRSQVQSTHDSGMMGLAFHPEFGVPGSPNRHYLYVYYRFTVQKSDTDRAYCRLSRFTWDPATNAIAPSSEYVLINQYDRHNWHNGGGLFFGLDGFLYLSIGDEGGANDQYNTGQKMDTGLLAGVLRIDVNQDPTRSHPIRRQPRNPSTPPSGWPNSYSQGYYIPNDNPWQSPTGATLEEFYAVGTRSPHRMTQDRVTGEIWLGDIGQGTQEEISKVVRGGNLQWPYREGNVAGPKTKPNPLIGFDVTPVHAYGRSTGGCVIGGYVYRGALHPELTGKYLFGDHNSNAIWSLDTSSGSTVVTQLLTLSPHGPGPKNGMGSFGIDASGELYVLSLAGTDLDGGRIYRIEKSTEGVPEPPRLLSQTTAFSNLTTLTPAAGVMPYDVNQPLWSDGADKKRWIAIPNDGTPNTAAERITYSEDGNWAFPVGTVLIKHFEYPGRRLETRFFVYGDDLVWYGFTYRWNEDGTDAELLPGAAVDATVTVNGTQRQWHFPSRNECTTCHSSAAGRVLGVKTRQLNGDLLYPKTGRTANQIVTLNRLGFFTTTVNESTLATVLTSKKQNDATATLERRARSYLDVNCSHCHQPAAPTQAAFDARLETPPFFQNLINVTPGNNLGITGARLVSPGRPDLSVVHRRVGSLAPGVAMPPIAKNLVDDAGLQLLADWINSLDSASVPTGPVTGTPPRDHTPPTLTLTKSGSGTLVTTAFTVTLTASEAIRGVQASDFTITNGTISNVSGSGTSWTFRVTPAGLGAGSISLPADRIVDVNGNANLAISSPLLFDYQAPLIPGNRLTGGEFENGLTGWDNGGGVSLSGTAYRGLNAAQIGGSTYLVRTIPVTELTNYLYSGWITSSTPGVRVEAGLTFGDANGVWIRDRIVTLEPTSTWSRFELPFTAPVGARSVSVWILTNGSGGVSVDDLAVTEDGTGEPRPVFGPGFTNLLTNGTFESGLAPWDLGGQVALSTNARTGTQAAAISAGSFIVVTRTVLPGESLAFGGSYFTSGGAGPLEAGFSFWDASGTWITDRTLLLPETSAYRNFLVDTVAPERAATVTYWIWRGSGGAVTVDDLYLFRPDESIGQNPNLLTNGGFENPTFSPWDTGGSNVQLVANARTGSRAARLGSESFLVHNQSASPGETYQLSGYHLNAAAPTAPREAGFSFWSSTGAWLGDAITPLPNTASYARFDVTGLVPAGAVSFSAWVWTGANGDLTVDDLELVRSSTAAAPAATTSTPESALENLQEAALAGDLTKLTLKSGRSLDLSVGGALEKDPDLALALGATAPVYAKGWGLVALHDTAAIARGIDKDERKSIATTVNGPGLISAQWLLDTLPSRATLVLIIDGIERERWSGRTGTTSWRTVAAKIQGPGIHTIEFRLESGRTSIDGDPYLTAGVRDLAFHRGYPSLRPDLAISYAARSLVGDGIYHSNGVGQGVTLSLRGRKPATATVLWSNDAPDLEDGVRLSGPAGDRSHRLAYYLIDEGRRNITSEVIVGEYESDLGAPGSEQRFDVELRRKGRGKKFSGIVRGASLLDRSKIDAVRVQSRTR
ncbi:MAG: PQQ-dependent sugar dehydrogenase [Verrucomicrobiales bacterium]|nr:PQQ-dependent sugar dehydrogenase [Verrucomicrobiales bacterium]